MNALRETVDLTVASTPDGVTRRDPILVQDSPVQEPDGTNLSNNPNLQVMSPTRVQPFSLSTEQAPLGAGPNGEDNSHRGPGSVEPTFYEAVSQQTTLVHRELTPPARQNCGARVFPQRRALLDR